MSSAATLFGALRVHLHAGPGLHYLNHALKKACMGKDQQKQIQLRNLKAPNLKIVEFANSIGPDEAAHNKLLHLE